jgi:hypothetical protein
VTAKRDDEHQDEHNDSERRDSHGGGHDSR